MTHYLILKGHNFLMTDPLFTRGEIISHTTDRDTGVCTANRTNYMSNIRRYTPK